MIYGFCLITPVGSHRIFLNDPSFVQRLFFVRFRSSAIAAQSFILFPKLKRFWNRKANTMGDAVLKQCIMASLVFIFITFTKGKTMKEAETIYPVHQLIRKRWSVRSFSGESISRDQLFTMFEAAAWAASSMNEQPWRYMYAMRENTEEFKRFHSCLAPDNKTWSANAAALILSLAKKNLYKNFGFKQALLSRRGGGQQ